MDLNLLHDGLLDLHIINPRGFKDYLELTKRYAVGDCKRNSVDIVFRVKEASVEVVPRQGVRSRFQEIVHKLAEFLSGKKLSAPARAEMPPCMIDGDPAGPAPMRVTVVPNAVNVLIPAAAKKQQEFSVQYEEPSALPLKWAVGQ